MLFEVLYKGLALVVQCTVHTELRLEVGAFVCRACDCDHLEALEFADLADERTDSACSAGDDQGLARAGSTDVEESLVDIAGDV